MSSLAGIAAGVLADAPGFALAEDTCKVGRKDGFLSETGKDVASSVVIGDETAGFCCCLSFLVNAVGARGDGVRAREDGVGA